MSFQNLDTSSANALFSSIQQDRDKWIKEANFCHEQIKHILVRDYRDPQKKANDALIYQASNGDLDRIKTHSLFIHWNHRSSKYKYLPKELTYQFRVNNYSKTSNGRAKNFAAVRGKAKALSTLQIQSYALALNSNRLLAVDDIKIANHASHYELELIKSLKQNLAFIVGFYNTLAEAYKQSIKSETKMLLWVSREIAGANASNFIF